MPGSFNYTRVGEKVGAIMTQAVAKTEGSGQALVTLLEQNKRAIELALPKHVNCDRIIRIALTEARRNPDLLTCDKFSFLGAVIQCAQLGLEPGGALGQCYLIPFQNNKKNIKEVQFMTGYQGMIDLVGRTAESPVLTPRAVYEGDEFKYHFGLNPDIFHIPKQTPDLKGKLLYAYCVAEFKDGRKPFDVMNRAEIDAIRARSKATGFSPWKSDFDPMAKKTVIRRMFHYLPKSVELQRALAMDDLADRGESQRHEEIILPRPLQTKGERVEERMASSDPNDFENFPG